MKKFRAKSKEMIDEATDIVMNTEDDSAVIEFLRETLVDDYPDLDLGKMDLHEAIGVLGGSEVSKNENMRNIENLNKSLSDFLSQVEKNKEKASKGKKAKKRKKQRRK